MSNWFVFIYIFCICSLTTTGLNFIPSEQQRLSAASYIIEAESLAEENEFCKTWTFVTSIFDEPFVLEGIVHQNRLDTGTKTLLIHAVDPTMAVISADGMYFDKMYTSDELMNSHRYGPIKHSRSCAVVLLTNTQSDHHLALKLTQSVVFTHLARPHKDYFIYIQNQYATKSFMESNFGHELRYKYFPLENGDDGQDICAGKLGGKSLFLDQCDKILNQRHLVFAAAKGTPWMRINNRPDGSVLDAAGVAYKLFSNAARLLNFTFDVKYSNNGGSTGFQKNGRWYGNVGEVYHRTADIACCGGITVHRDSAIDSGAPFEDTSRIFFTRTPSPTVNWKAIFSPFKSQTWLLILVIPFILVPLYLGALAFEYAKQTNTMPARHFSLRLLRTVTSSVMSILVEQEAGDMTWIGFHIKFLICLWMFFCLVIGAGYRSRLIYFLTFNTPAQVPMTHAALIQENYKLFFRYYGGVAYKHAVESGDPIQRAIVRRAVLFNSSQECIVAAILNERSACLDWNNFGGFAIFTNATVHANQRKDLIMAVEDAVIAGVWIVWMYRTMSPLIETFDAHNLAIFASGIYKKWESEDYSKCKVDAARWLNSNAHLQANRKIRETFVEFTSSVKALDLNGLYGAFALLFICSLATALIFLLEVTIRILMNGCKRKSLFYKFNCWPRTHQPFSRK